MLRFPLIRPWHLAFVLVCLTSCQVANLAQLNSPLDTKASAYAGSAVFVKFSLPAGLGSNPTSGTTAVLGDSSILVGVPSDTVKTSLVASFQASVGAVVQVGGVTQTAGVTAHDFSNPVTYQVVGSDGSSHNYTVSVVFGTVGGHGGALAWTAKSVAGPASWKSVAISNEGQYRIAADNHFVYTSNSYGQSWQCLDYGPNQNQIKVAISSDGQHMAAVSYNGPFLFSSDAGTSWSQNSNLNGLSWTDVALSADGSTLVASTDHQANSTSATGQIYYTDWTHWYYLKAPVKPWSHVSVDSNGTHFIATSSQLGVDGGLYTLTPYNGTFALQASAGTREWTALMQNAANAVAAANNGALYNSADNGLTWVAQNSFGSRAWQSVWISSDGQGMAGASNGTVYYSTDGGTTVSPWVVSANFPGPTAMALTNLNAMIVVAIDNGPLLNGQYFNQPVSTAPVSGGRNWSSVAGDAKGTTLLAAQWAGVYLSTDAGQTWSFQSALPYQPDRGVDSIKVAVSADGTHFAANLLDGLWVSRNSGSSWARVKEETYGPVAMSRDGTIVYATTSTGLQKSTNGGTSWTSPLAAVDQVVMSADGSRVLVALNGALSLSRDSGSTWSTVSAVGTSGFWAGLAMSADGSKIVTVQNSAPNVWVSVDGGTTWVDSQPTSGLIGLSAALSGDGARWLVNGNYYSGNSGQTWTSDLNLPFGNFYGSWINQTGSLSVIAADAGYLYLGR